MMLYGVKTCTDGCGVTTNRADIAILRNSDRYGIPSSLLRGIRWAESLDGKLLWSDSTRVVSNQAWALHYPHVKQLYAIHGRAIYACVGDFQVLWLAARDKGFKGSPWDLIDVETNCKYTCEILSPYVDKYVRFNNRPYIRNAIAAYNSGNIHLDRHGEYRNKSYVNRVWKVYTNLMPGGYRE